MLQNKDKYSFNEVLKIFELSANDIPNIQQQISFEEMNIRVIKLKEIFKKAYKKIVFKYHPDHGGSKEDMQVINKIYDAIKSIKPVKIERAPRIIIQYGNYSSSTTSADFNMDNFYTYVNSKWKDVS